MYGLQRQGREPQAARQQARITVPGNRPQQEVQIHGAQRARHEAIFTNLQEVILRQAGRAALHREVTVRLHGRTAHLRAAGAILHPAGAHQEVAVVHQEVQVPAQAAVVAEDNIPGLFLFLTKYYQNENNIRIGNSMPDDWGFQPGL
jgi:hypothetical protein